MSISTPVSATRPEESPVSTYQLFVQKERVLLCTPLGYEGSYLIKAEQEGIHYRMVTAFAGMLRDNRLREAETELFGEFLYDVLLNNDAGNKLHAALNAQPPAFLRLELHFEKDAPNWLVQLPWEYLYRPRGKGDRGYFLATEARMALVRCPLVGATRRIGVAAGEQLKVLVVACSPHNLERLEFAGFVEQMQKLEPDIKLTTLITSYVTDVRMASASNPNPEATFENFVEAMKGKPHVVHFLGHGRVDSKGGSIAFVNSGYGAEWKTQKDLEGVFAESDVRLAFLQACETAASGDSAVAYQALSSVAGALADTGIPAIVAMQAKIKVGPASSFAQMFYHSIVKDRCRLFRAMQVARAKAGDAACIPVLYLRYEANRKDQADLLFDEEPTDNSPSRTPGGAVIVEGPQCPWCFEALAPQQVKGDRCPYCRSDLRCPDCKTSAEGPFLKEVDETYCQKRLCEGALHRSGRSKPAIATGITELPRTDRPSGRTAPNVAPEQTRVGEQQQQRDVFQTGPDEGAGV